MFLKHFSNEGFLSDTVIDPGGCNFGEGFAADNADDFETVGGIFVRGIQGNTMIFMRSGQPGRFSFIPKGALTHHL